MPCHSWRWIKAVLEPSARLPRWVAVALVLMGPGDLQTTHPASSHGCELHHQHWGLDPNRELTLSSSQAWSYLGWVLRLVVVSWTDWNNPETRPQGPADKHGTTSMSGSWIFVINPLMVITLQTVILSWRLVYIESAAAGGKGVCLSKWVIEFRGCGWELYSHSWLLCLLITISSHISRAQRVRLPRHRIIITLELFQTSPA